MVTIAKNIFSLASFLVILFFLLTTTFVFAQGGNPGRFENPIAFDTLSDFLVAVLNVIVTIALPIIVLAIIYTGFLFVSAGGNEEKLKKAKQAIVWTLIGAMIILGAFVLSKAISGTVDEIKRASIQPQIIVMNQ